MKKLTAFLLDFLYPARCGLCGKVINRKCKYHLCTGCLGKVDFIGENCCRQCGKTLLAGYGEYCADCRTVKHYFDKAYSVCQYKGEMKSALIRYKFFGQKHLVETFGQMLCQKVPEIGCIDMVTSVPLHQKKMAERGFNQSEKLALAVSEKLGFSCENVLKRIKNTTSQSSLTRKQRLKNLKGAFKVEKMVDIRGKNILLIDDIYTTGSTVSECSKALKQAGANKVYVLTIASGTGF